MHDVDDGLVAIVALVTRGPQRGRRLVKLLGGGSLELTPLDAAATDQLLTFPGWVGAVDGT
jgi:hypothetical protein